MPALLPSSARRLAIVISADQWPLGGLGCYGNDWVDTTAIDTLAATGFVCDRGCAHAVTSPAEAAAPVLQELREWLQAGGNCCVLETSDASPLPWPDDQTAPRLRRTTIDVGEQAPATASDLPFARLIQAALRELPTWSSDPKSAVLWLHSAGLPELCLPPVDAWDLYAEEFSDSPTDWTQLSDAELAQHPAIRAAYLTLMDHLLGEFLQAVEGLAQPILVQFLAFRGAPWLTVLQQNSIPGNLAASRIEVPYLVKPYGLSRSNDWQPGRCAALVQPADLVPTMLDWLTQVTGEQGLWPLIQNERAELRSLTETRGEEDAVSLRTPEEQIILTAAAQTSGPPFEPSGVQRFWQPEDPWNVFDCAGESMARIAEVYTAWQQSLAPQPATGENNA